MAKTGNVDALLDKSDHPCRSEIEAIRAIIKEVNPAIAEGWKWNAPSFSYRGEYLVTFNLWEKQRIHLVFHNPEIPNVSSHLLEGNYPDRRMAYFADMADVQAKQGELQRIVEELTTMVDKTKPKTEPESDLPNIGAPARRALGAAGYVRLEQLTQVSEAELLRIHGMGPKALGILRAALQSRGLSFAEASVKP
jgi:uncharacterized protein YdhG (YjbR/CyaY superfamily)